jgi:hypothetical protein
MPKVYQRAAARRDLIEQFVYFAEHAVWASPSDF